MPFFLKKMFPIIFFLFQSTQLFAWNEDFSTSTPTYRGVCLKNLSALFKNGPVNVRTIPPDEACNSDEMRYQWVIGKEPKDSMALIPMKTVQDTFPPWVPSWPSSENSASPRVWHFTCVGNEEKEMLGTKMKTFTFKGEITAPVKDQSCEAAYMMAQGACKKQLGGNDLYEQCSGGSNYLLEWP